MRLLILGASGGCGQWLTRLAAERHDVTALVRSDSAFAPRPDVAVRRGDVTDPAALDAALPGHDVVLSCLGLRRAGRSPWAPLRSPVDLTARVTRALVPAMQRHGVRRLVAVSAAGVADSFEQCAWPVRRLVTTANVGVAYRDLAEMERLLVASDVLDLDWLAVRPVTLVDGAPSGRARPVERYGFLSTVRRGDVAAFMLAAAEGAYLGRRAEMIGA